MAEQDQGDEKNALGTVASGGLVVFAAKILALGLGFLTQVVLAQLLPPTQYGLVVLTFAVVAVAARLSVLGLDDGVTHLIPKYEESTSEVGGIVRAALVLGATAGVLVSLLLFLLATPTSRLLESPELSDLLKVAAVGVPFWVLAQVGVSIARGYRDPIPYTFVIQIVRPVARLVFIGSLVVLGYGALGGIVGHTIAVVIMGVAGLAILYHRHGRTRSLLGGDAGGMYRRVVAFSLPLLVVRGAHILISNTDTLMIGYFLVPERVGVYNVAFKIQGLLLVVFTTGGYLLPSMLTRLHDTGRPDQMSDLYQTMTKWVVIATLPLFLVLVLFPDEVIGLLFGTAYEGGATALRILAVGAFLDVVLSFNDEALLGLGRNRALAYLTVFYLLSNVVLNYWLVPMYGIAGAALATSISLVAENAVATAVIVQLFGLHPFRRKTFRILVLGLLFGAVAYYGVEQWGVAVVVAAFGWCCLYTVTILKGNVIEDVDLQMLAEIDQETDGSVRKYLAQFGISPYPDE